MRFILIAFVSALFFGASTPFGKLLLDGIPPFRLAGLFYFGAALGVLPFVVRSRAVALRNMGRANWIRLGGAIAFGGIGGPVLLLFGLQLASSSTVSLWLNLELVATAVLGFAVFRDHLGPWGWLGVAGTVAASVLLGWNEPGGIGITALLLVAGAGACWGMDNHLTALIDGITPSQSTFWKGVVAGTVNVLISLVVEPGDTGAGVAAGALVVGVFAYGFSITLYIYAAQNLGATRSQMIFASAPFFGVGLSYLLLPEHITSVQGIAAVLLAGSLLVLLRDQHGHRHTHQPVTHTHAHRHDEGHHGHPHPGGTAGTHTHEHRHAPVTHAHPHWPDLHHRHEHGT